jgi:hypothetical protein
VIQAYLTDAGNGLFIETRNHQQFTWLAEGVYKDANGDAFWYLDTHQYKNMFGGYYDPHLGITLQDVGNGWYLHSGTHYWYDGAYYQPYQQPPPQTAYTPPQQQITSPTLSNISTPTTTSPTTSNNNNNNNNNNNSGGGMTNADFRRRFLGESSTTTTVDPLRAMYGRVANAPTLTGKLRQLEQEALASDEALEAAIEELATGNHGMRSTIRGLAGRFTDERYDQLHGGHGHAEWATYQLFARLLALWRRKGKKPKEDWLRIEDASQRHGFDKDPEDRGGKGGSLGGSTHAPKSKLGGFFG